MTKLIALTAVALLASTANAGKKCNGTVILSGTPCQSSHVTYVTTVHPAARPVDAHVDAKADIVDTAVSAGSFKILVAAVQAAGLVDTLKGAGPFTVFAPTDAAFAKLPKGTIESLLKPENRANLQAILTYHVVAGKVLASDVVKISSAKTVNGKSASVKVSDAGVMIDGAKVVATDIETSNGVIHVIDSVILP
jgi:transforming growth factor-beta-induced protein